MFLGFIRAFQKDNPRYRKGATIYQFFRYNIQVNFSLQKAIRTVGFKQ